MEMSTVLQHSQRFWDDTREATQSSQGVGFALYYKYFRNANPHSRQDLCLFLSSITTRSSTTLHWKFCQQEGQRKREGNKVK